MGVFMGVYGRLWAPQGPTVRAQSTGAAGTENRLIAPPVVSRRLRGGGFVPYGWLQYGRKNFIRPSHHATMLARSMA